MPGFHLVRHGTLGHIGRFSSVDSLRHRRGQSVIVRTGRGLEWGEVLAEPDPLTSGVADGVILRRTTPNDRLLKQRLERHRQEALESCSARVQERNLPVILVDVEHLFDGSSLVFYFLGEPSNDLDGLIQELTDEYQTQIQFRRFADSLEQGCGPGCGTDQAEGGGCGSCSSGCSLAGHCRPSATE